MVRKLLIVFFLLPLSLFSQEESERFIHKGMLCGRGSIAFGGLHDLKANHIYLVGGLEYFVADRISLSGDAYYFVNAYGDNYPFRTYHSLFSGALFHLPVKGQTNIYVGLQPGVSFAQAINPCLGQECPGIVYPEEPEKTISPLASVVLGFRYFGTQYFHFNLDARYVAGRFMDNYNSANIGEFRVSFSLGFNLF
jgi:hypothetical protein